MSRILVLAAATALLGLTACNKPAEETVPPPAAAPAPEAAMPAESAPAAPPAMEKPAASAPETKPATEVKPAAEMKPSAPEPAKAEASVSKAGVLTRDEAMALAAKGNCVACHKIETRLVGPAWKDVGAKYKGDPQAVATITSHIKSGGSFGWKFGVMPPRGGSQISDADVENLAKFIASLK